MRLEHLALWVKDLEASKKYYCTYFNMVSDEKYNSKTRVFSSYFLAFEDKSETRIELMAKPDLSENLYPERGNVYGLAHIAISVGSKELVDQITEKIRKDGYRIVSETRITGEGYYESVVEDNEGNWIEITI